MDILPASRHRRVCDHSESSSASLVWVFMSVFHRKDPLRTNAALFQPQNEAMGVRQPDVSKMAGSLQTQPRVPSPRVRDKDHPRFFWVIFFTEL